MRWVMYRRRLAGVFEFGFRWDRLQPVLLRSLGAIATPVVYLERRGSQRRTGKSACATEGGAFSAAWL